MRCFPSSNSCTKFGKNKADRFRNVAGLTRGCPCCLSHTRWNTSFESRVTCQSTETQHPRASCPLYSHVLSNIGRSKDHAFWPRFRIDRPTWFELSLPFAFWPLFIHMFGVPAIVLLSWASVNLRPSCSADALYLWSYGAAVCAGLCIVCSCVAEGTRNACGAVRVWCPALRTEGGASLPSSPPFPAATFVGNVLMRFVVDVRDGVGKPKACGVWTEFGSLDGGLAAPTRLTRRSIETSTDGYDFVTCLRLMNGWGCFCRCLEPQLWLHQG